MSASRLAVALTAAFVASTASVWPGPAPHTKALTAQAEIRALPALPGGRAEVGPQAEAAWPPASVHASDAVEAVDAVADVTARLELTSTGAHRLVVDRKGAFVHVRYREVASGGPDWAAIELRPGPGAPASDVAIFEATDPTTLLTSRGLVRFSLTAGARTVGAVARPELTAAAPPRLGPRSVSPVRTCQAHDDGDSGFAVVCRITDQTSGVRAIRPASARPLAGAWVWDAPRAGKRRASRFVRLDLPLIPGGAEAGAIAYVHGARGFVVRAEATWPSRDEAPALLFTETSRSQPTSPFFSWSAPSRPAARP